ncbi:MAG TPA: multiheme c-type cytochrome [Bryobacteraceae bacterium]|nr:multiheme c-type cytochrome [Bryobacteraceae bacterium]
MARRVAFLLFLLAGNAEPSLDCVKCHAALAASYAATAHARASSPATAQSILGSFADGSNILLTRTADVFFRMEQQKGGFFQTGYTRGKARAERFDIVIGSGRRGQSYLYWRDGLLFQLPVSYHTSTNRWINSPGYVDGEVHFKRGIPPECLGCHAANFHLERMSGGVRYKAGYQLGIGCAQCHGEADRHEQLGRPGLEACARCHAGLEHEGPPEPDVHGNQVALLRGSRCFQKSQKMTCTTCHDVHQTQRDAESFSVRCQSCHAATSCPQARRENLTAAAGCVSCHMPVLPSKVISVQSYRTHRIAVYPRR